MKRVALFILSITFFLFVLALGNGLWNNKAIADSDRREREVVILLCGGTPPPSITIDVQAASSSAGAPVIPVPPFPPPPPPPETGLSCAQTIADLLNAHFKIRDVQSAGAVVGGVIYTLVGKGGD